MIIYNLLFKSIEKHHTPFCQSFSTFAKAEAWMEKDCKWRRGGLKCYSTDTSITGHCTDFRCEDEEGNSYYYVIFTEVLDDVEPDADDSQELFGDMREPEMNPYE